MPVSLPKQAVAAPCFGDAPLLAGAREVDVEEETVLGSTSVAVGYASGSDKTQEPKDPLFENDPWARTKGPGQPRAKRGGKQRGSKAGRATVSTEVGGAAVSEHLASRRNRRSQREAYETARRIPEQAWEEAPVSRRCSPLELAQTRKQLADEKWRQQQVAQRTARSAKRWEAADKLRAKSACVWELGQAERRKAENREAERQTAAVVIQAARRGILARRGCAGAEVPGDSPPPLPEAPVASCVRAAPKVQKLEPVDDHALLDAAIAEVRAQPVLEADIPGKKGKRRTGRTGRASASPIDVARRDVAAAKASLKSAEVEVARGKAAASCTEPAFGSKAQQCQDIRAFIAETALSDAERSALLSHAAYLEAGGGEGVT